MSELVSFEEVLVHLKEYYGLDGTLKSLGSCQDVNFKFVSSCGNHYVVKYANKETLLEELEFQHGVLRFLNQEKVEEHLQFPCPLEATDGRSIIPLMIKGQQYYLHILSYIRGDLLSDYQYLSDETLFHFGKDIAKLNLILQRFPREKIPPRHSMWDLKRAYDVCVEQYDPLDANGSKLQILSTLEQMQQIVKTKEHNLRTQLIHCDLAHYNVIAKKGINGRPKVTGVIDFGDILESWLVADLAIAITPLLIRNDRDCVHYIVPLVKGFTSVYPLCEEEIDCLWPMIMIRAILLYVTVSHLLKSDANNQYLQEEIVLNQDVLEKLLQVNYLYVSTAIRNAAGLPIKTTLPENTVNHWFNATQQAVVTLDISSLADGFEGGNWFEQNSFATMTKNQIVDVSKVYAIPLGVCWFTRSKLRSLTAPKCIPTFTLLYLPQHHVISSPFNGDVKVRDVHDFVRYHANDWIEEVFPLTSIDDVHWITIENDVTILHLIGRFQDVIKTQQSVVRSRDVLLETTTHSFPVVVQCYHKAKSISLDSQYPALFCDEDEWKNWMGALLDSCHDFQSPRYSFEALEKRSTYVASCQEHYFKQPPNIERGFREFLYDTYGRSYLDVVNNVAVVGHSHPKLTNAIATQLKRLNTNSRFVYSSMSEFAEQIVKTLPEHIRNQNILNKVIFVNSGSEATDLALRLARTVVTERRKRAASTLDSGLHRDVICVEGGYHGITTASDEVSTTLNDNPNSLETRAPWIHLVAMPNLFRGKHKLTDKTFQNEEEISRFYSDIVKQKIDELVQKGHPPSAFIAEPLEGNAGGVILPKGYLKQVYEHMRSVGAMCICDEVQIGYGRLGNVFWGFEEHDIVPDIITMAKAAGNGHPLGFVITSDDVIKDFVSAQGAFFSSAGGGPVSSTVGSTVLNIITEEKLQENALVVGDYLHEKLLKLQEKHSSIIACIHGHGLYQGIELAKKGEGKIHTPATAEAYAICERLLDLGVICHNTGDYSNVLKMKPPLCMSKDDADFFVEALDVALTGW